MIVIKKLTNKLELSKEIVAYKKIISKKVSIECKELNIYSYEKSEAKAIKELKKQIVCLYKEYVLEKEENLTEDAIEFKNKLKKYFYDL